MTALKDCGRHVAQAEALNKEVKTGYPAFHWRVIGQLAEAEEETVRLYPDLANEIREYRVAWTDDHDIIIPYEELFEKIDTLLAAEEEVVEGEGADAPPDDEGLAKLD